MGTDSVMGAPEGLLSVFLITGFLLGTCLNEETCVGDACFNEGILQLKIDRARTDTVSGLKYKERSKDLVAMVDVIRVCLPGVNPNVLADSFSSCKNEKMEEVCTVAKRGWLENKDGKSVVKENALLATFGEMKGGEDAVRECLQIPEVYEYEYYEYDYADYYEEYDYLEESGSRQRRAAASNGDNGAKKAKKEAKKARKEAKKAKKDARKRKRKKRNRKIKRGGKGQMKKGGNRNNHEKCKGGKNSKKCKNNRNRLNRKQEKEADKKAKKIEKAERRAAKKAARQEEKDASKSDKDDQKKALTKLGLQKMPSKSSLNKLTCVQNKIKELLVNCAKDILSKTN